MTGYSISDSPVSNLDAFDVVGVRNDGGLDLVISCSGPLDSSAQTIRNLETKVRNYLREILEARDPTLLERYRCAADATVRIIVSCPHQVAHEAMSTVERMKELASASGVELILRS
jgi:hypothetical protein